MTVPTTGTTPSINQANMAAEYGWALSVLNSNPELKDKFTQAVAQTWTPQRFIAEVRNTKWYKTTSAAARQWTMLQQTDPATANAQLQQRRTTVQLLTQQLGLTVNDAKLTQIAQNSLLYGWDENQIKSTIAQQWHYAPDIAPKGMAAQALDAIGKATQDYMVPISDQAKQQWTQQIMSGYSTVQDYQEYAKQQAKSLFPTLSAAIDSGQTVAQFADPYRQIAAQTLGINPNAVNFNDPKWRAALDQVDPKTGQRTVMSLSDWQTQLKKDSRYGYDQTTQGVTDAANLTNKLATMFGAM